MKLAKMISERLTFRNFAFGLIFTCGAFLVADGLWIKSKAVVAQILLNRAFLASSESHLEKPWYWADIAPIAKISVPKLGESEIVLSNASGEALAFGPGHLTGTPLPGMRGTSVLSAHRDTHFSWLGKLSKGDSIEVLGIDRTRTVFKVRRAWIAKADAPGINADSSETLLVLTTCWPLDGTLRSKWRYIVEGVAVSNTGGGDVDI